MQEVAVGIMLFPFGRLCLPSDILCDNYLIRVC